MTRAISIHATIAQTLCDCALGYINGELYTGVNGIIPSHHSSSFSPSRRLPHLPRAGRAAPQGRGPPGPAMGRPGDKFARAESPRLSRIGNGHGIYAHKREKVKGVSQPRARPYNPTSSFRPTSDLGSGAMPPHPPGPDGPGPSLSRKRERVPSASEAGEGYLRTGRAADQATDAKLAAVSVSWAV